MREIKFRAWDKYTETIVEVNRINFDEKEIDVVLRKTECTEEYESMSFEEIELMQYTGLFDDECREVYADDIVEIWDEEETKTPYISRVYGLTYKGVLVDAHPAHDKMGLGYKRALEHYCDYGFGGKYNVYCKVIGNIYENPELLKEEL